MKIREAEETKRVVYKGRKERKEKEQVRRGEKREVR